jgi:hypothetical protein
MAANACLAKLGKKQDCGYRGKMNRQKIPVVFILCIFTLLSCGIEEFSYLPQVPEGGVIRELTNKADVDLPSLTSFSHLSARYIIYYKIYIISSEYGTYPELISNISRISSDYGMLKPYTDPSSASAIPSLNTFKGRGFYELELEKTDIKTVLSAVSFSIQFPLANGEKPYINDPDNPIYRSTDGGAFNPRPTGAGFRYFFSSPEMNAYENATPTVNADVSGEIGVSDFAYTLMYIVAVGTNQSTFSRIYGKPTFLNIFKLPNIN